MITNTYANKIIKSNITNYIDEKKFIQKKSIDQSFNDGNITHINDNDTIAIPIIWHILYYNDQQKISDNQLESQIDALNKDYNLKNSDRFNTPNDWKDLMGNFNIHFHTFKTIRKKVNINEWDIDTMYDFMKFDSYGGSDAIDTYHKLNIWIVNFAPYNGYTLLGYAQFPEDYNKSPNTDGIVLNFYATGTIGTLYNSASRGRTATHEIGHWLGLRHIWGDGDCSSDDHIGDTPISEGPHYTNIGYPYTQSCGTPDMFMNYMDYGNDSTSIMFTKGQVSIGRLVFKENGYRNGFVVAGKNNNKNYLLENILFIIIIVLILLLIGACILLLIVPCVYFLWNYLFESSVVPSINLV